MLINCVVGERAIRICVAFACVYNWMVDEYYMFVIDWLMTNFVCFL